MVLECVRIRSLPSNVRESHIESDWSDLNIAEKGILHFQTKFYIFFKNKNDAEDAVNRGFRFEQKDYTSKQISIPDCINEMRSLLRDERRRVERYGETFCYPEIFELNNIKVKWDERKVLAKEQSSRSPEAKKKRKDSPPSSQKDNLEEDGSFENIKISVRNKNDEKSERVAQCKSAKKDDDIRAFSDFLDKTRSDEEDGEQAKKPKKKKKHKEKEKDKEKKSKKSKKEKKKRDRSRGSERSPSSVRTTNQSHSSESRKRTHRSRSRDHSLKKSRDHSLKRSRDQSLKRSRSRRRSVDSRDKSRHHSGDRTRELSKNRNNDRNRQQSKNRSQESSNRAQEDRGKRSVARDNDHRTNDNGEYNPLAMLSSSFKKDGNTRREDAVELGAGARRDSTRWDNDATPIRRESISSIKSGSNGGAVDLRAKLSRVNKRAEERAQRFGAQDGNKPNWNAQPIRNQQPNWNQQPNQPKPQHQFKQNPINNQNQGKKKKPKGQQGVANGMEQMMQMQQGMQMMMQMQQMMQMMQQGIPNKSAADGSLDEYMKSQSDMAQMTQMEPAMDPSMMIPQQLGPSLEQQIMEAKPMLKNMDTTSKKFIDTHCHIDVLFKKENYDGDWTTYMNNVAIEFPDSYDGCITSFCDPKLFSRKFAFKVLESDKVWACFGCHPHHAMFYNAEIEAQLEQLIKHEKVVAWGAIGLDYSDKYGKTDHDLQQAVFKRQCELAVKNEKPIVLQCRQAEDDLFRILKEVVPKEHKIHRHCLNNRLETVQGMLDYYPNMYVGFTNVITNFNAKDARDAATQCPIERMLIETDAPHFVPRTLRSDTFGGTTPVSMSHPGMALCVAQTVAQMQMKQIDEVIEVTRENARKIYGV